MTFVHVQKLWPLGQIVVTTIGRTPAVQDLKYFRWHPASKIEVACPCLDQVP